MRCTGRQTGWRISSGEEIRHFWARDFARCSVRGTCAVRRGNKKGRHLRFLPSLNTRFPCGVAWVQMVDCVSVEKGNGRGFLLPRGITPFRISAAVLLHRSATSSRRGITVPRNIFTCADYPRPAVVAGWHLQSVCAALLCRACADPNWMWQYGSRNAERCYTTR